MLRLIVIDLHLKEAIAALFSFNHFVARAARNGALLRLRYQSRSYYQSGFYLLCFTFTLLVLPFLEHHAGRFAMARKKSHIFQQLSRGSRQDRDQHEACVKLAARKDLNERFDRVAQGPQLTQLFADSTEYHIDRLQRLWNEYAYHFTFFLFLMIYSRYCELVDLEPQTTLITCCTAWAENFLHWLLENHTMKRVSSVETYWHQLSQLYIKWKGHRMEPLLLKKIYAVSIFRQPFLRDLLSSVHQRFSRKRT